MSCPQHKLVSLVGTISRDGQASSYEVVRRFAERTGAQCFPIPTPVVASSVEERKLLQTPAVVRGGARAGRAGGRGLRRRRQYRLAGADASRPFRDRPGDRRADRRRVPSARSRVGPTTAPGGWSTARSTSATRPCRWHELKQARMIGVSGSPERVDGDPRGLARRPARRSDHRRAHGDGACCGRETSLDSCRLAMRTIRSQPEHIAQHAQGEADQHAQGSDSLRRSPAPCWAPARWRRRRS